MYGHMACVHEGACLVVWRQVVPWEKASAGWVWLQEGGVLCVLACHVSVSRGRSACLGHGALATTVIVGGWLV